METRIIKTGEHPRVVNRAAQQAYVEAEHILESARQQAAEIIHEAELKGEEMRATRQEEGYKAGLSRWNEALQNAEQLTENITKDAQQQLIKLSVRLAEKIIGEQLRLEPDTVISIVREALTSARRETKLTLRVNPDYLNAVRSHLDRLRSEAGAQREYRVVADPKVQGGGCIIESEIGTIDARLEVQLQVIEELLLKGKR